MTGRLDIREYEAREGGKRTAVDIVADEIGPTLRWATVTIERQGGQGGSRGGDAPSSRPAARQSAPASDDGYYADEEPF